MSAEYSDKTLLLVEDESIIALTEKRMLQRRGFTVITALNAVSAIELAKKEDIDLILMDINLGPHQMDGTEAAEIILRDKKVPLIFLTNNREAEIVEKVRSITRYGHILKNAGEFVITEAIDMAFRLFEADTCLRKEINAKTENERQLKNLMSNLYGMVYRCENDPEWSMSFVSDGCYSLTGYRREELIGNRVISYGDLIIPEDRGYVWDTTQRSIESRKRFQLEYQIQTRNRGAIWVRERGVGVFAHNNELLFLEGYISELPKHVNNKTNKKEEKRGRGQFVVSVT